MSARMRAAVVGVGHLGRFHAEKYAGNPDVELAAVVDIDAARASAIGDALGVPALTDHRALAGRVDCASVAVPTPSHYAVARDLLSAGIDVLVEKPLTSSVERGEASCSSWPCAAAASCRSGISSASIPPSVRWAGA